MKTKSWVVLRCSGLPCLKTTQVQSGLKVVDVQRPSFIICVKRTGSVIQGGLLEPSQALAWRQEPCLLFEPWLCHCDLEK